MIYTADLIPTDPKTILLGFQKRAAANNANQMNDFQKMQDLANGMRKVLKSQCESYKQLVVDTYLDCDGRDCKARKTCCDCHG